MGYATEYRRPPKWKPAKQPSKWPTFPPKEPASNGERRRMLDATYHHLGRRLHRSANELRRMPTDQIYDLVACCRGKANDARRLLNKLIRLEPGRPATAAAESRVA